jgi:mRNA interferase MazF
MKDFQKWHHLKNELDKKEHGVFINEREICFVSIGENIGFEQNGKNEMFERPVLVLKKFGTQTFIGIPLTSKPREWRFYFTFHHGDKISTAILSQIRLFDTRRIVRRLGYAEVTDFLTLKKQLKDLLEL